MAAITFTFRCVDHHEFPGPGLSDFAYGEFVMYSEHSRKPMHLDALADGAFEEVTAIAATHPMLRDLPERERAVWQQRAVTVACDRTANGEAVRIDLGPRCPVCSSTEMESWTIAEPVREWELPRVTFTAWSRLGKEQKRDAVLGYLSELMK